MTVTTHFLGTQEVLYLGGSVAERAVGMDDSTAIEWAISEATYRFPCLRWREREWAIHDVDRAEPENAGKLPSVPRIEPVKGGFAVWPSKLALAPVLADMVLARLPIPLGQKSYFPSLPVPPVAELPWESALWVRP